MKIITFTSYKGGVGKTTSSICFGSLCCQRGATLLIDADPNRSARTWASLGNLPFRVCGDSAAAKLMGSEEFDFVIFDTPARPTKDELLDLADGCDLLIVPTTPDSLALEAMALMLETLPSNANFQILLTMIPPTPQKDGEEALQALRDNDLPVFERGIRFFKVYKDAAALRLPVYKARGGKKVWRDWVELAKLSPLAELLAEPLVSVKS